MEDLLEVAILGNLNDDEMEYLILENILVDRDHLHNINNQEANNFSLDDFSNEEVKEMFRFERQNILQLIEVLSIPEEVRTERRVRVNGVTALCILLRRLAYPNRLSDISSLFNLSLQSLSEVIKTTINIIMIYNGGLLNDLRNLNWLNQNKMLYYSQAIYAKGGAVENCWAFIDGTARQICRPSIQQEQYYSGHKRYHCLKYQSVLCPDGIIASLKGAYTGRRHDAGIFRESRLYDELEQVATFGEDEKFCLYGDQAYGLMELLLTPFQGRPEDLQPYEQQFNQSMKNLRVSVEWGFQKVVAQFAFIDFRKNQKLLMQDVDDMYKVAVLLTNCHTCLYGSQTATYFNIVPPNLNEYFGN